MKLENLCQQFPISNTHWDIKNPSKALPFMIRARIHERFGRAFAASDTNKRFSPNRIGIIMRPFEYGDPIASISRSHFIKHNSILTKQDHSQGRRRILAFFHTYKNMEYKSAQSNINKGQAALGILALLEEIYKSLAQSFSIITIPEKDFAKQCLLYQKEIKSCNKVCFLSDLLFSEKNIHHATELIQKVIFTLGIQNSHFFVIRDPQELNSYEPSLSELLPWGEINMQKGKRYFDNVIYQKNIEKQLNKFQKTLEESKNSSKCFSTKAHFEEIFDYLINENNRKMIR